MLIDIKLKNGVTVGYHAVTKVTDLGGVIQVECDDGKYFRTVEKKSEIKQLILTMEWDAEIDCPKYKDECVGRCCYCEHQYTRKERELLKNE